MDLSRPYGTRSSASTPSSAWPGISGWCRSSGTWRARGTACCRCRPIKNRATLVGRIRQQMAGSQSVLVRTHDRPCVALMWRCPSPSQVDVGLLDSRELETSREAASHSTGDPAGRLVVERHRQAIATGFLVLAAIGEVTGSTVLRDRPGSPCESARAPRAPWSPSCRRWSSCSRRRHRSSPWATPPLRRRRPSRPPRTRWPPPAAVELLDRTIIVVRRQDRARLAGPTCMRRAPAVAARFARPIRQRVRASTAGRAGGSTANVTTRPRGGARGREAAAEVEAGLGRRRRR